MTVQTNAFGTFAAIGNREDLTNVIYNISPTDTPFMSAIGKSKAKATKHEWQTDSLASASTTNAQIEGDVVVGTASTATVRLSNICQISSKDVVVTGTQEVVDKAGRDSELARQKVLKTISLKQDLETRIIGNYASVAESSEGPIGYPSCVPCSFCWRLWWRRADCSRAPSPSAGADCIGRSCRCRQ